MILCVQSIAEKRDSMTPIEILNKIVQAESNAREIYSEAESLREGFDNYVNKEIEEIRKQYYERADKMIAEAKERETARAEAAIQELDKKLEAELDAAKKHFEREKDAVVLKIFKLAVDADA
jgi:uncharacterized iron-regulated protein